MILRETLLYIHITGAMLLVAGAGTSVVCKAVAASVRSPHAVVALVRTAAVAVRMCALPGALVLLIAGIALVVKSHGMYSFGQTWIAGAIFLWLVSGALGSLVHMPRSRAVVAAAERLIALERDVDAELRSLIRGGWIASAVDIALLAGMLALMVYKPGY